MNKKKPFEPDIQRNDFEPRLPNAKALRGRGILARLKALRSSASSGQARKAKAGRRAKGSRGGCAGPKLFSQRVVVKARVVKGSGSKAVQRMRSHLAYLSRSGTGLTGSRPEFFSGAGYHSREELSKKSLEWGSDPHHFRLIISPERGSDVDLEDYVRCVVKRMEVDLKTKLEWYAACHHNTDNAHAHLVFRGMDEKGQPLTLAKDYISHGIRQVAEREATVRLGERDRNDLERSFERSLLEEKVTSIDRDLVGERRLSVEGLVQLKPLPAGAREFHKKARLHKVQRLAFLESRGLAKEVRAGVWQVSEDLEGVLKELSNRRKIEALVAPYLRGLEACKEDLVIHKESAAFTPKELLGVVIAKDLLDELYDKRFILLSGNDGRTHFIPLGPLSEPSGFESKPGQVVRVIGQQPARVRAEEVIHRYLRQEEGTFAIEDFRRHVSAESKAGRWSLPEGMSADEYAALFAARCESLARLGLINEVEKGAWKVPVDIVARADEMDNALGKKLKVSVSVASHVSLADAPRAEGSAWIDRLVGAPEKALQSRGVFGLELQRALAERREVLEQRGVALGDDTFERLVRRDERTLEEQLAKQHRKQKVVISASSERYGKVSHYVILGDEPRMVVLLDDGYVIRRVGKREAKLLEGTPVTVTMVNKHIGGRAASVLQVRPTRTNERRARARHRR